jgi:transaldolase
MANVWLSCENDNSLKDISSLIDDEKITGVMIDLSRYSSASVDEDSYLNINTKDIQEACDKLIDLYDDGEDGFVCCSIDPRVSQDTKKILQEATKLYDMVDKENFMVSIPATKEGIEAMKQLSTKDMNICATHIFSPNQASQSAQALSDLNRKADTVLRVDVSPFDELLNVPLATNNLSKDRIGFFNAIKIYNQIAQMKLPNSNIKVCFDKLSIFQSWLEPSYYVEQLNLDNAILNLSKDVIEYISEHEVGEAFEFQTKHIDAFLGYLAYANVSLQSTYEELLQSSLQKDANAIA